MIIEIHIRSRRVTAWHKGERHEGIWNETVPQEQQDEVMRFAKEQNVGRTISGIFSLFDRQETGAFATRVTIEI